jgi:hypothetical protein
MAVSKLNIDIIAKTEVEIFEKEGLDTDLSDIFTTTGGELFTVLKNGEIRKTIVHICDIRKFNGSYTLPKFHIFECQTLTKMRNNNRSHRYKKVSRTDGKFWVIRGTKKSYETLKICNYNCLSQYNNIYNKNKTVMNFSLQEYIKEPIKHIEPYIQVEDDMTTIPTDYSSNWKEISLQRKEYYKWICQECFFDCSPAHLKRFLHTHHINADRSNNNIANLKVLCIECHSNQFNHSHIKEKSEYKEFLKYKEKRERYNW